MLSIQYTRLQAEATDFEDETFEWFEKAFPEPKWNNLDERCCRFLEEAIELVQSLGLSKHDCEQLIKQVYNQPKGNPDQEVGGVMITLNILCSSHKLTNPICSGVMELDHINEPETIEKIRAKQAFKHHPIEI